MDLLDQLLRSSFRSVEFWVENESTTRGQKVALHEYPNQDYRYAEGLGKIPPTINLTCIVHGSEYVRKRFALERALENPEIGTLRHPVYGSIKVRPGKFTVGYSASEVGKFTFNVAFHNTAENGVTPEPVKLSYSSALSGYANAVNGAMEAINDIFIPPVDPFGLGVITDTISGVVNTIQDAAAWVPNAIDSVTNTLQATLDKTEELKGIIGQTSTALSTSFSELFAQLDLIETDGQKILTYTALTEHDTQYAPEDIDPDTGEIDTDNATPFAIPPGKTNTVQRKNNETNKLLLNEATRVVGLAGLMKELAFAEFWDIDTLEKEVVKMDMIFQTLFVDDIVTDLPSISSSQTIRKIFKDLRATLNGILNSKRDNLWSTTDVETPIIPLSLLTYRHYGSLDELDTIIKINPERTVNSASDSKKMLT